MEKPFCPDAAGHPTLDPTCRLIETFGFRPGQGIARRGLHIARLAASAEELGFLFDKAALIAELDAITGEAPLRCRLTLSQDGAIDLTTAPMPDPWRVATFIISDIRLPSGDPLLRHKTTRRTFYDQARAALPEGVQEAVMLNERDEVCEGTITNIAITTPEGDRLTPPLSSGLLAGVYRQSRLNRGLLREATLTLADLKDATSINLINSLRGSTQAHWAPECAHFPHIA